MDVVALHRQDKGRTGQSRLSRPLGIKDTVSRNGWIGRRGVDSEAVDGSRR